MQLTKILPALFVAYASAALADSGRVTLYADGMVVEQRLTAVKGVIALTLPPAMIEGSLRVSPDASEQIRTVEVTQLRRDDKTARELEQLGEQQQRLQDRLQALEVREEIFRSAAKSQSGKAPRKSKANPDPLNSIRQGTDFAIAQLEAVYTARRRTQQELRRVEARSAQVRAAAGIGGQSLRIVLSRPRGSATIRYASSEPGWTPQYRLQFEEGSQARLQLFARPASMRGTFSRMISAGSLHAPAAPLVPATDGQSELASYLLPVSDLHMRDGIRFAFSGLFANATPAQLPAGEMGVYRSSSYLGTIRFAGISSGRSRRISMGSL